jgi:hypothetical protein
MTSSMLTAGVSLLIAQLISTDLLTTRYAKVAQWLQVIEYTLSATLLAGAVCFRLWPS